VSSYFDLDQRLLEMPSLERIQFPVMSPLGDIWGEQNDELKEKQMRTVMVGSWLRMWALVCGLAVLACGGARAESVVVKYRGPVDLAPFTCENITRSSFIDRVCYDAANDYMLIELSRHAWARDGVWYHYCEIDGDTVSSLLAADSMGRYYNASIKGRFDCRTHKVPEY
jgi:hypothetical protein